MQSKPLKGYKVLDMSIYGAGPSVGRVLGDWGADVIKVETLEGDTLRYQDGNLGVPFQNGTGPNVELFNANKRSISVNLKTPEGLEIMERLLASADVFNSNMRLKALRKMGLDYETIHAKYPKLIWAHESGYGTQGPMADDPGFDTVAYWAQGGLMADLVERDTAPMVAPIGVADLTVGPVVAGAICAALLQRKDTGVGEKVTFSLYGLAAWSTNMMTLAEQGPLTRYPRTRTRIAPFNNTYKCKDGEWIMIMMLKWDVQFPAICKLFGMEEYVGDPRFANADTAYELVDTLIPRIDACMLEKNSDEWDRLFTEADIPHARLKHMRDMLKDEQARANHYVYPIETRFGTYWLGAPPVQLGDCAAPEHRPAPLVGEHTAEIMRECGYTEEQIRAMEEKKIIRQS